MRSKGLKTWSFSAGRMAWSTGRLSMALFEEIAKIDEASVRRIYGDFYSSGSRAWVDVLSRYAIILTM